MAYPVTLNGRTYTLADFEGTNYVDGLPDAFEDFVTHAGAIYKTTSTTSNTIGTGSKSFTTADNSLPYQEGTPLRISDGAAPSTNWMDGIVTAYSGTSLTVNVVSYAGSGTLTDWDINIGGGGTSYTGTLPIAQGGTGATTAGAAATNLGLGTGDSPTFTGLSVDGGTIKLDGNYPVGTNNVALGDTALDSSTSSTNDSVAVGSGALTANTGDYNTAVGSGALTANSTGVVNDAFGYQALYANTTARDNVAIGSNSLWSNTTGASNTAVGRQALNANTTADSNTAVGYQAGYSNTTGAQNTALGALALDANTTGNNNTALGWHAGGKITTASENTVVGRTAMYDNTTGQYNTAIGSQAMYFNTTANNNTALGYQAGYNNTTASNNVFVGVQAGYTGTTSDGNTYIGYTAGNAATGNLNTFIGASSGVSMSSGAKNTILGRFSGNQGGLDIRTSSNNIVLSDGDGNPRVWVDGNGHSRLSTAQGSMALSGNQHITFNNYNTNYIQSFEHGGGTGPFGLNIEYTDLAPNANGYGFLACQDISAVRLIIYSNGNVVNQNNSYGAISDEKLKENIVDSGSQWDDIKALRVRKYSLKADELDAPNKLGVVAQELEAVGMAGLVIESPDLDKDNNDLGTITKSVNYSVLYMKAVKALQEAMERIETLEAKVTALENA